MFYFYVYFYLILCSCDLQDIDVIVTNVKNSGQLSLDSFKRNNVSASWMVVGQENVDDPSFEVGIYVLKFSLMAILL